MLQFSNMSEKETKEVKAGHDRSEPLKDGKSVPTGSAASIAAKASTCGIARFAGRV